MAKSSATDREFLPRHGAFYIASGVGAAALVLGFLLWPSFAVALGANAMFATFLVLIGLEMPKFTPAFLKQRASEEDAPVVLIFLVTAIVVVVAVASLFLVLNGGSAPQPVEIAISLGSVVLGWFTIHTLAALHYAYEYYETREVTPGRGRDRDIAGGLRFPDCDDPDGAAFLYFAYVIGMTAQVADVAVSSNAMRRLVTVHGVVSFFFNTVIVAAMVNVVVSVGGGH